MSNLIYKDLLVLVVTELFNIAVSYFDAKKFAHSSHVLVVAELVVSGTHRILMDVIISDQLGFQPIFGVIQLEY